MHMGPKKNPTAVQVAETVEALKNILPPRIRTLSRPIHFNERNSGCPVRLKEDGAVMGGKDSARSFMETAE